MSGWPARHRSPRPLRSDGATKRATPTRSTTSAYRASRGMPAPRRDLRGGYSSTWRGSSQLGAEASPRPCRELPARRSLFPGATGAYPTGVRRGAATGTRVGWPSWRSRSSSVAFQGSPSSHAGTAAGIGALVGAVDGAGIGVGVGEGRVERPTRNAGASSASSGRTVSGDSISSPGTDAEEPVPAPAAAAVAAAAPTAPASPAGAGPAAVPHGGGAFQSLAPAPGRAAARPLGEAAAARGGTASRGDRAAASTFTGAASRRAQSTKVGQPANDTERQYAAWWASARGAAGLSAKHLWRWSGPGAR